MRDDEGSHGPYLPFALTIAGLRIFESVARMQVFLAPRRSSMSASLMCRIKSVT